MTGSLSARVVLEDDALLCVVKPGGISVIPGRGQYAGPGLRERLQVERNEQLWVVHRLDAAVSGLLLFARTAEAHRVLSAQFEARTVRKRYRALVWGRPEQGRWVCDTPVGPGRKGQMRLGGRKAKPARTSFERGDSGARDKTWTVFAHPETGRRHQLRLHLAAAGHPIVGDVRYLDAARVVGGFDVEAHPGCLEAQDTIGLEAIALELTHPVTGAALSIVR